MNALCLDNFRAPLVLLLLLRGFFANQVVLPTRVGLHCCAPSPYVCHLMKTFESAIPKEMTTHIARHFDRRCCRCRCCRQHGCHQSNRFKAPPIVSACGLDSSRPLTICVVASVAAQLFHVAIGEPMMEVWNHMNDTCF